MQWNLKALFLVSSIMAAWSCLSSLLLLYFALTSHRDNVFRAFSLPAMPYGKVVTLIYLKVAVSDFLTLFSARAGPRPFWATRPALVLLAGAGVSLLVTTLVACLWPPGTLDSREISGLTRGPGHGLWPLWVWLYCIVVFLLQDATKARPLSPPRRAPVRPYRTGQNTNRRSARDVAAADTMAGASC